MAIIQPQSPKAQRELLQRGSQGMLYGERGAISRAAPVVQEALRLEIQAQKKRMMLRGFYLFATALVVFSITIFFLSKTSDVGKQVITGAKAPVKTDQPTLMFVEAPKTEDPRKTLDYASTPQEFVNRATVNGVRLGGRGTRAIINGALYHVGDVVAPEMGLVFVGHDPDGEYLLFRDASSRTIFLRVYKESEAS
ncbi:hypothetical protein [Cerasicoccus arenae]|uniref:Uncharacterized protein n=1 Tax=Cerasicoccus arenae TaxID=424488 RepID=A0A8J3GDV8_9BACT|nr:hypothetical protein [Cerasicoccus arenae]MBK1858707.1 hypothetical protein [Cerasicoccus arenae]GHB98425.1 hypothetical protein GCM10007047_13180 [Cerasicoccus arenae]